MINWILALIFIGSRFFSKQSLIEYLLRDKITAPPQVWRTLNILWISFFLLIGAINILVAYNFDTNTWVNFKVFGMLGLTFIFGIIQAVYISKNGQMHVKADENKQA